MPLLGAHVSVAGGLPLAVDRAAAQGCDALQIFTKSSNQWRARPLPPDEIRDFRERLERAGIGVAVAHASYLINLASSDPVVRGRSLASLGEEIDRVEALGLLGLVIHPGCATTGTVEEGLRLIAAAVREALRPRRGGRALVILEQTAGQGRTLGSALRRPEPSRMMGPWRESRARAQPQGQPAHHALTQRACDRAR